MTDTRTLLAARNNALWCNVVCETQGLPTEFRDSLWLTNASVPRFYPNVVTLEDKPKEQLAAIEQLYATVKGLGAVKDSFASLDLAPLGFTILFEATWLWHEPSPTVIGAPTGIRWGLIETATDLAEWERAWDGNPAPDQFTAIPRVFLPSLLADPEIAFIAAYQEDQIIAGAIANRTGEVVGLSNVFTPEANPTLYWAGCLTALQKRFPTLPVVDYETGAEVEAALAVGFEKLDPLRVWLPPSL
jgi:hypothetical protein